MRQFIRPSVQLFIQIPINKLSRQFGVRFLFEKFNVRLIVLKIVVNILCFAEKFFFIHNAQCTAIEMVRGKKLLKSIVICRLYDIQINISQRCFHTWLLTVHEYAKKAHMVICYEN